MKTTRLMAAGAVMALGLSLAACSTASETAPTPAASESPSGVPENAQVGADPSTWGPQEVEQGTSVVTSGEYLVLSDLPEIPEDSSIFAESSDPSIIWLSEVGPGNYAMVNARELGAATVDIFYSEPHDSEENIPLGEPVASYSFTVEAFDPNNPDNPVPFDDSGLGSDPATWTPVTISPNDSEVEIVLGQYAVVDDTELSSTTPTLGESSNPEVFDFVTHDPASVAYGQALGLGTAELTVDYVDGGGEVMKVKVTVVPNPYDS